MERKRNWFRERNRLLDAIGNPVGRAARDCRRRVRRIVVFDNQRIENLLPCAGAADVEAGKRLVDDKRGARRYGNILPRRERGRRRNVERSVCNNNVARRVGTAQRNRSVAVLRRNIP